MKHILLVDDEPEVIEGLVQILSQIDRVHLHTANLASQALKLMEKQPMSLVIADIRMPGMNGIEMWEAIHQRQPQCKVIFLSGVRDFDHIYRIIQNPSARFLTKMEPEEKILATVEETLAEIDREEKLHEQARLAAGWLGVTDTTFLNVRSPENVQAASKEDAQNIKFQLQILHGYLNLGQKDSFHSLVTSLFSDSTQSDACSCGPSHLYFGVLALLYERLENHDAEALRQKIRSEQALCGERTIAWPQRLNILLALVEETFELLFPTDPYAHPEVITSIQRYIHDHLDKDLSLNALSLRFNISPNYLSRLFRENTGYKLHEYITQLRLGTAERLLCTSGAKVNQIARQVGYESSHTFIRAFRKHFGVTPQEYRAGKCDE